MPDGRREETCCGRARPAGRGTPEETRSALRHQLQLGRAPATSPSPRILRPPELPLGAPSAGGLTLEHVSIATEVGERCPLLLVRRASSTGPLRPVFVMHGTGGSNLSSLADGHLQLFANLGMLAVGVDSRHHGCRLDRGPGCCGARPPSYWDALIAAWRAPARAAGPATSAAHAHPFIYDTCWDLMAVLDWLEGRDDVDCSRVGAFGKSLGGMHAWIWAAADTRVSACCPAIGVQCFDWALRHDAWHARVASLAPLFDAIAADIGRPTDAATVASTWDKLIPGMLSKFDAPCTLGAIMPRPCLVLNNAADPRCPRAGLEWFLRPKPRSLDRLTLYLDTTVADGPLPLEQCHEGHVITRQMLDAAADFITQAVLHSVDEPTPPKPRRGEAVVL